MFSSLSSYIWGSEQDDQVVPEGEITTNELQADDEWVLVDVVSPVSAKENKKSDKGGNQESSNTEAVNTRFATVNEESWYITPPSCFNASQAESCSLETSPLENLLIEHPSMSVYGSPEPLLEEDIEYSIVLAVSENSQANSGTGALERTPRPRGHQGLLRVVDKVDLLARRVQKNVAEQAKKKLRKKTIEHSNKTHDRSSHSRRKRKQIDRKQGKQSGVYSNRGC